jgi:hypothetical protein
MWSRLRNRIRRKVESPAPTEADQAVTDSQKSLYAALQQDREVRKTAADLRYQRVEVNHIAERVKASLVESPRGA